MRNAALGFRVVPGETTAQEVLCVCEIVWARELFRVVGWEFKIQNLEFRIQHIDSLPFGIYINVKWQEV